MSAPEIIAAAFIGLVTLAVWAWVMALMVMGAVGAMRDLRAIEQRSKR